MAMKKRVAYVGPKENKRITMGGRKFIFPKGKPVEVEESFAYQLLDCKGVFVEPEDIEKVLEEQEATKTAQEAARKAAEEAAQKDLVDNSGLVIVNGETFDINKSTNAKINTWIVAEGLDIDVNNVERLEDETPKQALVRVVRLALHEKNGNPEAQEEA
ncbi:hypothetical protein GL177_19220 [Vibrio toranzoniae]|uniref:hypothetical protein n=1 Tax=Vibrio toranzoniae TaxID=1194427 RepID=UPI001376EA57|nr:hypothetical protein [Vibrio toranzoniae]NAZ55445.1 hypothetical protein [Vibrio toranzoniae]